MLESTSSDLYYSRKPSQAFGACVPGLLREAREASPKYSNLVLKDWFAVSNHEMQATSLKVQCKTNNPYAYPMCHG